MRARWLAFVALLLTAAAALFWLGTPGPSPPPVTPESRRPPGAAPEPAATPAPDAPATARARSGAAPAPLPGSGAAPAAEVHEAPSAGTDDAFAVERAWYAAHPLSAVPHDVVRGWGAAKGETTRPGVVGVYVVVDPHLPTAELEELARDIYAYHADAAELSARVFDSEEAATYDRHTDGGARAERHLVAMIRRNERLDVDSIEVRGHPIAP